MTDEVSEAWELLSESTVIPPTNSHFSPSLLYGILRWTVNPLLRVILRLRLQGVENVPLKGAAILAANHLSHVDPFPIVGGCRRKTFFLAKDEHFKVPILSTFLKAIGQIKINRESGGGEALSGAIDVLDSGNVLGIFPEGTRSKAEQKPFLLPGKTGVARLAASHPNIPVIPVAHEGAREVMIPKKHKLPRPWKKMKVNYGCGITWREWVAHPNGGAMNANDIKELSKLEEEKIRNKLTELYRKFTDQLMGSIKALGAP